MVVENQEESKVTDRQEEELDSNRYNASCNFNCHECKLDSGCVML